MFCAINLKQLVNRNSNLFYIMSLKRKASDTSEPPQKKTTSHWSHGLLNSLDDPKLQVMKDDKVTVIKDKYPKAKYHYLVMPREDISSLRHVKKNHVDLLKHMDQTGRKLAEQNTDHEKSTFKLGYHAQPSMVGLHLHVLSDDMNSDSLRTKKHWNSFTSEFFLDSKSVIDELEKTGTVSLPSADECKKLMCLPLKCHKCDAQPKNMPELKKHILTH